jgi:hypothetical protein
MNEKFLQFSNIGTPNYLIKLIKHASKSQFSIKELKDYFINISIDNRYVFDGGISFLIYLNFFIINQSNKVQINKIYVHFINDEKLLLEKINRLFLIKLKESSLFELLFNKLTMLYEDNGTLVISNKAFKFKYANIRHFLLDFNVISKHPYILKNYVVMKGYKSYFDSVEISRNSNKRILTLPQLKHLQELKNLYGENAEKFVVDYEKLKFNSHELVGAIEKISDLNVSAGYDVVSLQSNKSTEIDKFIEVKSYSDKPSFYWSVNEVKKAKQEKNRYFLYLVNRNEIDNNGYNPVMIQDPYKNIFNSNNWERNCESWFFKEQK